MRLLRATGVGILCGRGGCRAQGVWGSPLNMLHPGCPVLQVPGRTFPVEIIHALEDHGQDYLQARLEGKLKSVVTADIVRLLSVTFGACDVVNCNLRNG